VAPGKSTYRGAMTASVRSSATGARRPSHRRETTGGADGNERLTAATGAVLLVLFAAEGATILAVRQLLTLHFFLGMLLIGPVLLKASATIYRFIRYYTGAPDYRRKGPPALPLRLLGPFVLLTSLAVIGTGVMLGYAGRDVGWWLLAHKAAFVLWFAVITIHVLAYAWRLPGLIAGDVRTGTAYRAREMLAGRRARWLLLAASVLTGLLLGVLTFHQAGAWLGSNVVGGSCLAPLRRALSAVTPPPRRQAGGFGGEPPCSSGRIACAADAGLASPQVIAAAP